MTMVELDDLVPNVSRETRDRLYAYSALVSKWNPKINLVSKASIEDFWQRHIIDSAQIFAIAPNDPRLWVDLGSGGGLPAVVLSILAEGEARQTRFILVESDQRKAVFLRTVARELGLSFQVLTDRSEDLSPQAADVVSARALASLDVLLEHANRHLSSGGVAIFPKGRTVFQEIESARTRWNFEIDLIPSKTEADAKILKINGIQRA